MKYDAATYRVTHKGQFGTYALAVGLIGLAVSAAAWYQNEARFYHAWLTAFVFWLSLALAGLFFTMLHYLTASRWSVVLRRISEALMMLLPWLIVAFLPVYFGLHDLFHWSHPEAVAADHLLQGKSGYLNVGFFVIRALVFFAIWGGIAFLLRKRSLAQDADPHVDHIARLRKISAIGMLLFAVTVTYASFDWLMSLQPHWYSTVFGVYLFGGSFLGGLALITVISWRLRENGVLRESIGVGHYHDLGKLMFAFIIFWAYIGFSQYFLIWYGNIPEETFWFLARWQGGWKTASLVLFFGHFALPFVVLIFQRVKRHPGLLSLVAIWILAMHWLDMYWLVYPTFFEAGAQIGWIEIAPVFGLGGLCLWQFWKNFVSQPIVPVGDPWLKQSLEHVNH